MKSLVQRSWALLLLVSLCGVFVMALPSSASSMTSKGSPSLSQLEADISESASISNSPNLAKTIPPLSAINDVRPTSRWICYRDRVTLEIANECSWGDKSATAERTILLFGDSNAAMWLRALNVVGSGLGWRVIFLAIAGCQPWLTPWLSPSDVMFGNVSIATCNSWRKSVLAYVQSYKPAVVIPVGVGPFKNWSTLNGARLKFPQSHAALTQSIVDLVNEIQSSGSHVVLLQPMPRSNVPEGISPSDCLTIHGNDLKSCLMTPKVESTLWAAISYKAAASKAKIPEVETSELFCGKKYCPLFAEDSGKYHLIYLDADHMDSLYSGWIGNALKSLMRPVLAKL